MIPAWVESYIGIPFQERGRTHAGIDCWGCLVLVYQEVFGIRLPSYEARYDTTKDRVAVARLFFQETTSARWRRIAMDAAAPPDVLSISLAGNSHAAILVTPDRFLHVLPGRETCIERIRPSWESRIDGVYRHEELVLA